MTRTIHLLRRHLASCLLILLPGLIPIQHAVGQEAEDGDAFGRALATGDFNGDGYLDLAVGAPYEILEELSNNEVTSTGRFAGAVNVIYGSLVGLTATGDQFWHRGIEHIEGEIGDKDLFSSAVVSCDFDGDGFDDVAIGVPYSNDGNGWFSGSVNVLYGSDHGLTHIDSQLWYPDWYGAPSPYMGKELTGTSLAAGDFNGDSYCDLAVGAPGHVAVGAPGALTNFSIPGTVYALNGTADGLDADGYQMWHRKNTIGREIVEGDAFGQTLTTGDFDGDGLDDLAIGIPGYDILGGVFGPEDAGAVLVLYGRNLEGLSASEKQLITQHLVLEDGAQTDDKFGEALAAGDFDGNGADDLAIGVPREDVQGGILYEDAGAVNVVYGVPGVGLSTSTGSQFWYQYSYIYDLESEDGFGSALSVGDFDGDGLDDLAIGAPREDVARNGIEDAGDVTVLYGTRRSGLILYRVQTWHQDRPNIDGVAEAGDGFGRALAAGDFDGNGADDLAIGVPGEDVTAGDNANDGAVNVIYGFTDEYLTPGLGHLGNRIWHQSSDGIDGDGNPIPGTENKASDLEHDEPMLNEAAAPAVIALEPNYPNPFVRETSIRFNIQEASSGAVRLDVFDVMGKQVRSLVRTSLATGPHTVTWDGRDDAGRALAPGMYVYRLQAGDRMASRITTLLR